MSQRKDSDAPARDSKRDRDNDRPQRDLLVFLLILLLGFGCLLLTAQMAVRPQRVWQVPANMLSELNPDEKATPEGLTLEPLRPEVLTPPAWDPRYILTPVGTAVVIPPATFEPLPSGTPTPSEVAEGETPSPTATSPLLTLTPTLTPTPSQTPTGTPTPTTTPTSTPTGTPTSTPTSTPSPTPSPTPWPTETPFQPPPRPTTAVPTPTDTPTPTPTPIPPPPTLLSITPNHGVNSAPVSVVITGTDFFGLPTAILRTSDNIAISEATTDTLTGTVPAGLTPGVYALTVRNPDGQSGMLSPAYTVLNPPSPNTTLETGYVVTFGPAAPGSDGDDDHVQLIFFDVPDSYSGDLFFRVFDANTGGAVDEPGEWPATWDTTTTYTLRGDGAYKDANARASHPIPAGISSGALLAQTAIGSDGAYDGNWALVFGPFPASAGDLVSGRRVFKLAVEGSAGNDGNYYNVALSTVTGDNIAPPGSRVFAYSWTFALPDNSPQWLYPYVVPGPAFFEQHNWDMDIASGSMTLYTPLRTLNVAPSGISTDGTEASSSYRVDSMEPGATWTVMMQFSLLAPWDDLTFWVEDGTGTALAIFTRPTMIAPP